MTLFSSNSELSLIFKAVCSEVKSLLTISSQSEYLNCCILGSGNLSIKSQASKHSLISQSGSLYFDLSS